MRQRGSRGLTRGGLRTMRGIWGITAVLALVASCGEGAPRGAMAPIPPPDGWQAEVERQREQKDAMFRDDEESPIPAADRADFAGLEYWEPDPAYYFVGQLHLDFEPQRFEIVSTSGKNRPCERVGWIAFVVDGEPQRLHVYRLLDQPLRAGGEGYFLPFMDGTTGEETYPAGRYIELRGPEGGPFVLDFNSAYNPYCAYGDVDRYVCPVTPQENRLDVRIESGERGWKERIGSDAAADA